MVNPVPQQPAVVQPVMQAEGEWGGVLVVDAELERGLLAEPECGGVAGHDGGDHGVH